MPEWHMHNIITDENQREILPMFSYDFPIVVFNGGDKPVFNSDFTFIPCHWHDEIEINIVLYGEERMFFGDEWVDVKAGEGVFFNVNVLHKIKKLTGADAHLCIIFNPSIINGNAPSLIDKKFIQPFINCDHLKGLKLSPEVGWQADILNDCYAIREIDEKRDYGYELEIQQRLSSLWQKLVVNTRETVERVTCKKSSPDEDRMKAMMLYIHAHYPDELTLESIAASANISVSECCRCFKRVMAMTPFAYLIQYRLGTAAKMLRDTNKSVSDISHAVGFETESYFSRKFKEAYGHTPSQFRKK